MAAKTKALAKRQVTMPAITEASSKLGDSALRAVADLLSMDLTPGAIGAIHAQLGAWEKNIKDLQSNTKQRLVALLKDKGQVVTNKGSRELLVDGYRIRCKPYRSGVDPKKLEALVRAKGLDPEQIMQQVITYDLDPVKLGIAVEKKLISSDEAATCVYDESWTLETPKKVSEE